ncbi:ankyrin repeat domain-containing protein [Aquimarina algicola]|nr:ankyrin repeat domain-containing protein [Aquimarina algicola]
MKSNLILTTFILMSFFGYTQEDIFEHSRNGNTNAIKKLYESNSKIIDTVNHKGFSPLILAVYNNQIETTTYLLEHGANPDVQDTSGNTALMGACFKGYVEMIKLLIKHKVTVDQQNYNDATALIFASTFGHTEIVKELLKNGADLKIKDNRGNKAVDHARMQGNTEIVALLESK